ncbi:MAG: Neutral/alkaline non-lysosomal ceramidase, N-terminal, partial [Planctomycetota bacterium]
MPLSTSDIVVRTAKSFLKILIILNQQARMQRTLVGTIAPILFLCGCVWSSSAIFADESPKWFVGVAKTDITPEEPVRLSGYASRTTPATEIEDRLFARALILTPTLQSNAVEANAAQSAGGSNGTETSASDQTSPTVEKPNTKEALVIVSIDAIGIT